MTEKYFRLAGFVILSLVLGYSVNGAEKATIGYVEKTSLIYPANLLVKARIDSGAELFSLHCDCITPFQRNGEKWVMLRKKSA